MSDARVVVVEFSSGASVGSSVGLRNGLTRRGEMMVPTAYEKF